MAKKAYVAQIERFGYTLTSLGRTKGEAHDAIIETYIDTYKRANGIHPKEDIIPGSNQSHLDLAEDELYITAIKYGETRWL